MPRYTDKLETLRNDVETLRQVWSDYFRGPVPSPSQFATWLRMYPIDICAEGLQAGARWIGLEGRQDTDALVRYTSAVMRNKKQNRELDGELQ
jgi:hypothetical protein